MYATTNFPENWCHIRGYFVMVPPIQISRLLAQRARIQLEMAVHASGRIVKLDELLAVIAADHCARRNLNGSRQKTAS
jgi:hypothetical protein